MRLKKLRVSCEEEIIDLINEYYEFLNKITVIGKSERESRAYLLPHTQYSRMEEESNELIEKGEEVLSSIFPTQLECFQFQYPEKPMREHEGQFSWYLLISENFERIQVLREILRNGFDLYTDMPLKSRLHIEDIDSFRKVRDINPSEVEHLLEKERFDILEDEVQTEIEKLLNETFHKEDWGGEINDLYTSNLVINGKRIPTAFLLKGRGLKKPTMEIKHCGKNGDQILRLLESPAELFVIQFVGNISENVIKDIHGKIYEKRTQGEDAWYLIMNGQDTARLLLAYNPEKYKNQ